MTDMKRKDAFQPGLVLEPQTGILREKPARKLARRANGLDGATWTRNSISIWSDIKKTQEEIKLGHPALFPIELVKRLIQCFTTEEDHVVLDPFVGVGSTAIAAQALGKVGIGIEISEEFSKLARSRPVQTLGKALGERIIYTADASDLLEFVRPDSVDLAVTSPPYWDILLQKRTADYKQIRHYGDSPDDLGKIGRYDDFLFALQKVFMQVFVALKPGKYCCVVVMDIRKKDRLYLFHADLTNYLKQIGFELDDIIIWDRRHEYNNVRPLGYPSKFRINKAHEYILIFRKPSENTSGMDNGSDSQRQDLEPHGG